ncbi:MAG: hypothetical protein CMH52_10220 [Myxococcales bacterium]|nr:hypothetical protein [Myxococcales bacterium]
MIHWLTAWVLLLQLGGTPAVDKNSLQTLAQTALKKVERMRGQVLSAPLKMGVKSRAEILTFVTSRLSQEYGPEKVKAEGWLLKDQGFLSHDIDYGQLVSELLSEQIAGFYDHTRQELHIADWLGAAVQEPVMAHEIFHAIQDQEWGGGRLLDSKRFNHDQILAHAALLEGDATIVMLNYSSGADMSTSAMTINMVAASLPMQMSSNQFPTMAKAPLYLKQSLIFPYQQGLLFVSALRQSGLSWTKIREVYKDPPRSTEQILHPKKYYSNRDHPSSVELPDNLIPGFKVRWSGATGEFHARQLLLQKLPTTDAISGAEGWDGDQTVVLSDGARHVSLTYSVWDSVDDARDFAKKLRQVVQGAKKSRSGAAVHSHLQQTNDIVVYAFSKDGELSRKAVKLALKTAKVERR